MRNGLHSGEQMTTMNNHAVLRSVKKIQIVDFCASLTSTIDGIAPPPKVWQIYLTIECDIPIEGRNMPSPTPPLRNSMAISIERIL